MTASRAADWITNALTAIVALLLWFGVLPRTLVVAGVCAAVVVTARIGARWALKSHLRADPPPPPGTAPPEVLDHPPLVLFIMTLVALLLEVLSRRYFVAVIAIAVMAFLVEVLYMLRWDYKVSEANYTDLKSLDVLMSLGLNAFILLLGSVVVAQHA